MPRSPITLFAAAASLAIAFSLGAGCGPGESADGPATTPAEQGSPVSATLPPPAALPLEPASVLYFKEIPDPRQTKGEPAATESEDFDRSIGFAGARLKLTGRGGHQIVALLHSEDPPEGKSDTSDLNRYYFRMPLQITDRQQLDGARFRLTLELSGAEETSNGVFLRGDQEQLQPIDLLVGFEVKESVATLSLRGLFKFTDVDAPQSEPRWFHVRGTIRARVE